MPKGLPDSWALWGAKKIAKSTSKGFKGGRRGASSVVTRSILQTTTTKISYKFGGVKIYEGRLNAYLNSPSGDLWKWLEVRGNLAVAAAKAQVGVRTGALRSSIHKKHTGNVTGQYLWIGSHKSYAYLHHEGVHPHVITSSKVNGKPKPMVFRKGTVLVHATKVNHPGVKANPYLRDQLRFFNKKYN
jgi:hypothetical protein